jgi:hypothetical protein
MLATAELFLDHRSESSAASLEVSFNRNDVTAQCVVLTLRLLLSPRVVRAAALKMANQSITDFFTSTRKALPAAVNAQNATASTTTDLSNQTVRVQTVRIRMQTVKNWRIPVVIIHLKIKLFKLKYALAFNFRF